MVQPLKSRAWEIMVAFCAQFLGFDENQDIRPCRDSA